MYNAMGVERGRIFLKDLFSIKLQAKECTLCGTAAEKEETYCAECGNDFEV